MNSTPQNFHISFIGIGPQKTGSTWLHEVLKNHPAVCLPHLVKEVQFFDLYYHKGMSEYQSYFSHCQEGQLPGEITPGYFDEEAVPERIHRHFPEVKLIISLRHPVKRAESLFRHHLRKGRVSSSFSEAIEQMPRIVDSGRYSLHMARWYEYFSPRQIKVILMEDIASDPQRVLREVLEFLAIDPAYQPANLAEKVNRAGMPRYPVLARYAARAVVRLKDYRLHRLVSWGKSLGLKKVYDGGSDLPSLSAAEKIRMLKTYEQDVNYVEKLLGKSLPTWKETY